MDKKYDIFISYARKDIDEVKAILGIIKRHIPNLTYWFDVNGIESGDEFEEKIISAIDNSSYVLFALSDNSLKSPWTKDEVMYAKNTNKKIVPILLKNAKLSGWFLFKFGRIDCIDSTNVIQMNKLINNLNAWTSEESNTDTFTNNNISDTNKENTLYLKIISDTDCHVLIDCEEKCTAKANKLYKVPLKQGEYYVQFISCANDSDIITEEICLERDTLYRVNLATVKKKREEVQQSAVQKSYTIQNDTTPATAANYNVILRSSGPAKLQVVKCVKEACGLGLKEAKDIVDYTPSFIARNIQYNIALKLKKEIEQSGAIVEISIDPNAPCPCGSGKKFR